MTTIVASTTAMDACNSSTAAINAIIGSRVAMYYLGKYNSVTTARSNFATTHANITGRNDSLISAYIAGWLGAAAYNTYTSIAGMIGNNTYLTTLAGNTTLMTLLNANTAWCTAIAANIAKVIANTTFWTACCARANIMATVAANATAMATVAANATAMATVAASSTALRAIYNSATARAACIASTTARNAFEAKAQYRTISGTFSGGGKWYTMYNGPAIVIKQKYTWTGNTQKIGQFVDGSKERTFTGSTFYDGVGSGSSYNNSSALSGKYWYNNYGFVSTLQTWNTQSDWPAHSVCFLPC
jgi:hypothetical protein